METRQRIGQRVRAVRRLRGLTQEELAARIGRSVEAVSALERGKSNSTIEGLDRLAEQLGVPIRDFLDYDESDKASGPQRIALLTSICDVARDLGDRDLEIAVEIVIALAGRNRKKP